MLPKVGSNLKNFFCRIAVLKKKTRLQISISSLHMNRTWVSHGTFQVLFISEVKTQNCGRGIFFGHRLFLVTNRKFQSRLTLSAYNSASKALNLKKYHIFGIPRTSAFTWYPPRYMMQHQNFEKLTKYKKRQNFVNFHCRPPQFMSEAAARTILTLRTLDIAHFEAETRSFSGVSSKLGPP